MYKFVPYGVSKETETIDYDELDRLAREHKPKMIVAGASAYSRIIDFARMAQIAQPLARCSSWTWRTSPGLVAAGVHPSPVPHADFVSTTTHKTLRGPRGGLVLCKAEVRQGTRPHHFPRHPGRSADAHHRGQGRVPEGSAPTRVSANTRSRSWRTRRRSPPKSPSAGFRIVSGGTDNHLFLVDLYSRGLTGKDAQPALDRAGITVNKNSIPFDPTPPMTAGGIRMGTPAITTRGMREPEMERIAGWIAEVLSHLGDADRERRIRGEVAEFATQFPLYTRRWDTTPSLAGSRDAAR